MDNKEQSFNDFKEDLLKRGSEVIREELDKSVDFAVTLRKNYRLDPSKVVSDNILINREFPKKVKRQINDFSTNLEKLIAGVASRIEEKKFETIDEAIDNLDLLEHEKEKVIDLHDKQKKVSYSLQTLNILVEVFTILNENIKNEIESNSTDLNQNMQLRIKNAILVYELTTFVTKSIEDFALAGKEDIEEIKNQVFNDLEENERKQKNINLEVETEESRIVYESKLIEYENIRKVIKSKWEELDAKLNGMDNSVSKIKSVLPRLRNVKADAEIQLDLMRVTFITKLIDTNIEIAEVLPDNLEKLIVPYRAEDACKFLGINV